MTAQNDLTVANDRLITKAFDLSGKLPNLHTEAKEIPIDLSSSYWTPEREGDNMRGFFQRIENATYTNERTGEVIELPCIIFVAQNQNGEVTTIRNGSKRLVASIEEAVMMAESLLECLC